MWTSAEKSSNAGAFRVAKGIDSFCVEFLGMNAVYKQHHVPFSLGLFHANVLSHAVADACSADSQILCAVLFLIPPSSPPPPITFQFLLFKNCKLLQVNLLLSGVKFICCGLYWMDLCNSLKD